MKRLVSFPMIVCIMGLVSCSKEQPNEVQQARPVSITASIKGMLTRASNDAWSKNDSIGIFATKAGKPLTPPLIENMKYISVDGTDKFTPVSPEIETIQLSDDLAVDFMAYYPYKAKISDTYPVDVSTQTDLPAIDLLYSSNATNITSTEKPINMVFTHQLSKIILMITSSDTSYSLDGLQATLSNTGTKANYSLTDGTLSSPTATGDITFNVSSDGKTAEAIVLPVSELMDEELTLTVGNHSYNFFLNTCDLITSFQKSTLYTFHITLDPQDFTLSLENVSASINDWSSGPSETVIMDRIPKKRLPRDFPPSGDGTVESPFNVAAAILESNQDKRGTVWVTGYIVGSLEIDSVIIFGKEAIRESNVVLADDRLQTDLTKCMPAELDAGYSARDLNLKDHPEMYLKKVCVRGVLRTSWQVPSVADCKYYKIIE